MKIIITSLIVALLVSTSVSAHEIKPEFVSQDGIKVKDQSTMATIAGGVIGYEVARQVTLASVLNANSLGGAVNAANRFGTNAAVGTSLGAFGGQIIAGLMLRSEFKRAMKSVYGISYEEIDEGKAANNLGASMMNVGSALSRVDLYMRGLSEMELKPESHLAQLFVNASYSAMKTCRTEIDANDEPWLNSSKKIWSWCINEMPAKMKELGLPDDIERKQNDVAKFLPKAKVE